MSFKAADMVKSIKLIIRDYKVVQSECFFSELALRL